MNLNSILRNRSLNISQLEISLFGLYMIAASLLLSDDI